MKIANFILKGGIKHYFEELKTVIPVDECDFLETPKIRDLISRSRNGEHIIFTHLTKETIAFLCLGGRCTIIWHDPKLRTGYTWREALLYFGLLVLRPRVSGLIVHSDPDRLIGRLFDFVKLPMPVHASFATKSLHVEKPAADLGFAGENKINLLFFGRVVEYKGLHHYLTLFNDLEDVNLVVAGEVSRNLKGLVKGSENVRILDEYVSDEDVSQLFTSADYVFMPYHDITNTQVHNLAFIFGKPVIRTEIPGFNDWKHVCSELIFRPKEFEKLHSILKSLPKSNSEKYEAYKDEVLLYCANETKKSRDFWIGFSGFVRRNS